MSDIYAENHQNDPDPREEEAAREINTSTANIMQWLDKAPIGPVGRKLITALCAERDRFKALHEHLPAGYSIGDDAAATLAVDLMGATRRLADAGQFRDAVTELIRVDGREGSDGWHAFKHYDARAKVLQMLGIESKTQPNRGTVDGPRLVGSEESPT